MAESTISEKTRLPLSLVIAVAVLVAGAAGGFQVVKSSLDEHKGNCALHHDTEQLDERYVLQQVSTERYERLSKVMERIEAKLDRIEERGR
jgi:hypothetical protein